MAVMWGADADELDDLGRRMTQAADLLDTIRHEVSAALGHASWEGDDAADFHGLWTHRLAGLLQSTTGATRDASTRLHRNATEQRRASATDTGNPTAPLGQPKKPGRDGVGLGEVFDWASIGASTLMLGVDGLDVFHDIKAIGNFADKPWVQFLTKDHALFGLTDEATGFKGVLHAADDVGPLALVGAGVDGYKLGTQLAKGEWNRETLDAGVDVAFDVAEAATIEVPPLALGIGAAHVAFDVYEKLPPNVQHDIADAATAVVRTEVEAVVNPGHVISGGVNLAKHLWKKL